MRRRAWAMRGMVGATLLLGGCGSSSSPAMAPQVLHHRLDLEFTLGEGSETAQARTLLTTLKHGSLVSCWSEGPNRVCAAAVPKGYGGGIAFMGQVSDWTYYRAVFKPGVEAPEVDEVSAEQALRPEH